jgi:D-hydroxyproline dehydrogenase subunit gamma
MFRRLADAQAPMVSLSLDGQPITARAGDSVAAALLANGALVCRETPVTAAPRGPYCLMGICFECLVSIDGIGSRQACMTPVREGMRIETQAGRREPAR